MNVQNPNAEADARAHARWVIANPDQTKDEVALRVRRPVHANQQRSQATREHDRLIAK
ncbi:hypothetical protein FIU89_11260 [Roseovarius sp. THAF27]|nr:hypothetical protein FIU89_11260 [Roseovarius sp. THAF27]